MNMTTRIQCNLAKAGRGGGHNHVYAYMLSRHKLSIVLQYIFESAVANRK